jgi:hypothetical protein
MERPSKICSTGKTKERRRWHSPFMRIDENILYSRTTNVYIRVVLKPQDVVVVLKLCEFDGKRPPFAQIAEELFMSASEVHGAVKRAQASHLLHGIALGERPNCKALEEFLIHGLKYVFPAQHGAMTRGMPTSYAAEPLRRFIKAGDEPPEKANLCST